MAKSERRKNFPGIRGFECFPEGKLLSQKVDFSGPIGIAYERCIGYTKPRHSHDRITITFPRGASRSFIKTFPDAQTARLHEGTVHVMAKDQEHEQGSVSTIYDTFALFVTPEYLAAHLKKQGARSGDIAGFIGSVQTFAKSAILTELVNRYFVCRILESAPLEMELKHLESLILTELFMSGRRNRPVSGAENQRLDETALARAVEFIETHLFDPLDVEALVRVSRTSQATLFRLFKRELRASPIEYVRNRRLDEARSLLKGGEYQVGDVALLVGYEDLSSFSKSFKARFRIAPSACLPKRP